MMKEISFKTLVISLSVILVLGQTDYRVSETDEALPADIVTKLAGSDPVLEIVNFTASHRCNDSYLVEGHDYVYVDFVAGNPNSQLDFAKPGPQVIVSIENASNLIICIKGYEDCGDTYDDEFGLPCNCKNISTSTNSAVRVKGYWSLNPTASNGDYLIIWEESIDPFLNPNAIALNITRSVDLPLIYTKESEQYRICDEALNPSDDGGCGIICLIVVPICASCVAIIILVIIFCNWHKFRFPCCVCCPKLCSPFLACRTIKQCRLCDCCCPPVEPDPTQNKRNSITPENKTADEFKKANGEMNGKPTSPTQVGLDPSTLPNRPSPSAPPRTPPNRPPPERSAPPKSTDFNRGRLSISQPGDEQTPPEPLLISPRKGETGLPPLRGTKATHQGTTIGTNPEICTVNKTKNNFDGQATRPLPSPKQSNGAYDNIGYQK